jgi:hypothetical protein
MKIDKPSSSCPSAKSRLPGFSDGLLVIGRLTSTVRAHVWRLLTVDRAVMPIHVKFPDESCSACDDASTHPEQEGATHRRRTCTACRHALQNPFSFRQLLSIHLLLACAASSALSRRQLFRPRDIRVLPHSEAQAVLQTLHRSADPGAPAGAKPGAPANVAEGEKGERRLAAADPKGALG